MAAEKKRQSNIELLRILAMLMIIGLHYLDKGGVLPSTQGYMTASGYVAWLMEALFFASVNVFFLISGYFSLESTFSLKKVWSLWLQIFMYSFGIGLIAMAISGEGINLYRLFGYIFPVVTNHYWFATVYILLYLLSPILKVGFLNLDQKTVKTIIFIWMIFLSVSKSIIPMNLQFDQHGYDLAWMLGVYLTGMYISRFGFPKHSRWMWLGGYLLSSLIIFLSMVVLHKVYLKTGNVQEMINYGYSYNFIFCFLASVCLFMFFLQRPNIKGKAGEYINKIAGVSFGVYLFHEQMDIRYLWPKAFRCQEISEQGALLLVLHMLLTLCAVYGIGFGIEQIRRAILHPIQNKTMLMKIFIFLYALRNSFWGVDMLDAGYALGNYKYIGQMNLTWKLATYLANVVGAGMMALPLGNTWVGMNVYTAVLIGIVAVWVFSFLVNRYGEKEQVIFIGTILSLSLCWAPTTILYHYLGYLILTVVTILLLQAIEQQQFRKYIISGVLLGCALFVRMPNITYVALIVPTLYGIYLMNKGQKECIIAIRNGFLGCLGGYVASVMLLYGFICLKYGWNAYPDMIASLFGMTEQATDYKPTSMLTAIFGTYITYMPWLLLVIAYLMIGIACFKFVAKRFEKVAGIGYVLGIFVLLRLMYGRGFFGLKYNDFFAVYKWCVLYITIVILFSVYTLCRKNIDSHTKILSAFILTLIFIIPLGGNNGVHSVINSMFLIFPASLVLLEEQIRKMDMYPLKAFSGILLLCMSIQIVLFGNCFIFHDFQDMGSLSKYTHRMEADITGSEVTKGLWTTSEKNQQLDELGTYLTQNQLMQEKVLLYGNIPAISYIFDMEPAIFTTWPDLDSNTISRLEHDLQNINKTPVIITSKEVGKALLLEQSISTDKIQLLYDYMQGQQYHCSFFNDGFYVFTTK